MNSDKFEHDSPFPDKALTLHSPWAWAIVNGVKTVENRDWATSYRGTIFVHAGQSFESDMAARDLFARMQVKPPNEFARGVIVGTVDVVDILPHEEYLRKFADLPFLTEIAIGPWCWVLANPRICEPVRHPGNFQLWPVKIPPERFRFLEPPSLPTKAEKPKMLPLPGLPPIDLAEMFAELSAHYGPQRWWPAESPLEVIIGLILVRSSQWPVAERVIARMKADNLLQLNKLKELPENHLLDIIRPTGQQKSKAALIRHFVAEIAEKWNGFLMPFLSRETKIVREELLAMPGIGPETSDMILLYAANHPICPVDDFTKRILIRHALIDEKDSHDSISQKFLDDFGHNVFIFNELHALFVQTGRDFCLKSNPKCGQCPLNLAKSLRVFR